MTLPTRPWAAASADQRRTSPSARRGSSSARSTRASTRYSCSRGYAGSSSARNPRARIQRAASSTLPSATISRARNAGSGLRR